MAVDLSVLHTLYDLQRQLSAFHDAHNRCLQILERTINELEHKRSESPSGIAMAANEEDNRKLLNEYGRDQSDDSISELLLSGDWSQDTLVNEGTHSTTIDVSTMPDESQAKASHSPKEN